MTERDMDDVVTIGSADSMSTPDPIVTVRVVAVLPLVATAVVGAPAAGAVAAAALEPEVV
jgi:hypothetical protein